MIKYIKPIISSIATTDLREYLGLRCDAYGYVTMNADRAMLEQPNKQIVICKTISQPQTEIVKLG